jgi:hypothetical protein
MKKSFVIAAILFTSFFISCNTKDSKNLVNKDEVMSATTMEPVPATSEQESIQDQQLPVGEQQDSTTGISSLKPTAAKMPVSIDWDKKIIKTAALTLEVPDFKKYNDGLYKTVKARGGYIAQEDQNITAEKNETVITIKVPVHQFEAMMNELPGADSKIIERKISTDDVTAKIIDTKSRLEAKKEMRLKYLEFLKQSKNMKEVLQVQAEINSIQEEMESAASQVNYLSHQSAMSTINLTFYQLIAGYKPNVEQEPSFLTRVANAFKSGAVWMADLFVGLMSVWPLVLIICASVFIWRKARHEKRLITITRPIDKK